MVVTEEAIALTSALFQAMLPIAMCPSPHSRAKAAQVITRLTTNATMMKVLCACSSWVNPWRESMKNLPSSLGEFRRRLGDRSGNHEQ